MSCPDFDGGNTSTEGCAQNSGYAPTRAGIVLSEDLRFPLPAERIRSKLRCTADPDRSEGHRLADRSAAGKRSRPSGESQ